MKRALVAVGVAALLAVGLTGCQDTSAMESHQERIDRLYSECIAAGGSFEYNASLPYWQCSVAGAPLQK